MIGTWLVLTAGPAFAQQGLPRAPDFNLKMPDYFLDTRAYTFPSGLRVLLQRDESAPQVTIATVMEGGASLDPAGEQGTARLAEYMWFQSRPEGNERVQDKLYTLGATYHASTHADHTAYLTLGPRDVLPELLKLESQRLTDMHASTHDVFFVAARELIKNRSALVGGDALSLAIPHTYRLLYPEGHPYAHIGPEVATLDDITFDEVKAFGKAHYSPENTTILIAGDIDLNQASSILFWAFEPSLLHPKLTKEDYNTYFRPDISGEPDENNPWHLTVFPNDPDDPEEYLPFDVELPLRVEAEYPEPPMPVASGDDMPRVFGRVSEPVAVVAWSLPGGFRGEDHIYNLMQGAVEGLIIGELGQDPMVSRDPVLDTPNISCRTFFALQGSVLACAAGMHPKAVPETIAERMLDQVAMLWWRDYMTQVEQIILAGKNSGLTGILHRIDDLYTPGTGRPAETARVAHYNGNVRVQSDRMQGVMNAQSETILNIAQQHLDRKRAVRLVIEPLPDADTTKALLGANAYPGNIPDPSFQLSGDDALTDEDLRASFHAPDLSQLQERTLSNGLRVVVKPHGVVPTTMVSMVWTVGKSSGEPGLEDYAWFFQRRLPNPILVDSQTRVANIAGKWSHWQGSNFSVEEMKVSSGNINGAMWSMRKLLETREASPSGKALWVKANRKLLKKDWLSDQWWADQLQWSHLAPDHALPWRMGWEDIERFKGMKPSDVEAYQGQRYTPENGVLLVVGNVEPEEVFSMAENYIGGWKARGEKIEGSVPPGPHQSGLKTWVLDVPEAQFTTMDLGCRAEDWDGDSYSHGQLLAALMDESLKASLQEGAMSEGTLALLSFGSAQPYVHGLNMLQLFAMVSGDSAGATATRMRDVAALPQTDALDADRLQVHKLHLIRKYATRFQSHAQMRQGMVEILADPLRDFDWYKGLGDQLVNVTIDDLKASGAACADHAVLTVRGPLAEIGPSLDAAGITYEVYPWYDEAKALMTTHDPKAAKKMD